MLMRRGCSMLGDTMRLADNLWFIGGEMPEDASKAPDWCNVVIYQAADRVYVIDSGGGTTESKLW